MPAWVQAGTADYLRRFPQELRVGLTEIAAGYRNKQADIERVLTKEGNDMLNAVPKGDLVIALEVAGVAWDTPTLAQQLERWQQSGKNLSLLIGGPEGLATCCKQAAQQTWSLSPLTLPHPLVRVIVVESLYRAWSIITHHPYHRG